MNTRIKQFLLVAVTLGVTLSIFSASAQAETFTKFSMTLSSNPCALPCTVTVTDETPGAADHAWDFHYNMNPGYHAGFQAEVTAGHPACLTPDCSQARFVYSGQPQGGWSAYQIAESISNTEGFDWKSVGVIDPADAPADIVMVSPASLELPGDIVLASPKQNMTIGWCYQGDPDPDNNWLPLVGQGLGCFPYFVERTGPDASGLYYFRWKLPMSPPGLTVLQGVRAWSSNPGSGDVRHLTFTVTGNRIRYGDFRTCIDRFRRNAQLIYYTSVPTRVTFTVQQKVRQGQRSVWKVRKVRHRQFDISPLFPYVPVWAKYKIPRPLVQKRTRPPTRAFYVVRHGKKVIKRIGLSKQSCE